LSDIINDKDFLQLNVHYSIVLCLVSKCARGILSMQLIQDLSCVESAF